MIISSSDSKGMMRTAHEHLCLEPIIETRLDLLACAGDAIIVSDPDDRVLFWNTGAVRLYGWTAAEAVGRNSRELLGQKTGQADESRRQLCDRGEWHAEVSHVTKSGKAITVQSHWFRVQDREGRPASVMLANCDRTGEPYMGNRALYAEALKTFARGMSHALNNILSPILMAAPLLRQSQAGETNQFLIEAIESSARRGATVIDQVLSFVCCAKGERTRIDIAALVSNLHAALKETLPTSIQLRVAIHDTAWATVGNFYQLSQVLLSLCSNARDAMPHAGTLTIEGYNDVLDAYRADLHHGAVPGPYVVVCCTDTGVGIPPHLMDKIFEPFVTTKEIEKGIGLGLWIARQIVESHGGFFTVYSEVGRGTEFKVYLRADTGVDPGQGAKTALVE